MSGKPTARIHRYIICEGPDDTPYIEALLRLVENFFDTESTLSRLDHASLNPENLSSFPQRQGVGNAEGGSQVMVVKKAVQVLAEAQGIASPSAEPEGDDHDQYRAWVFTDADRSKKHPEERAKAEALAAKHCTATTNIRLCFSDPCFEFFILSLIGAVPNKPNTRICKKELPEFIRTQRTAMDLQFLEHDLVLCPDGELTLDALAMFYQQPDFCSLMGWLGLPATYAEAIALQAASKTP